MLIFCSSISCAKYWYENVMLFYFTLGGNAKYCEFATSVSVFMSVCMSVSEHILKPAVQLHQISRAS